jgi:hypothetical protein
VDFGEPAQHVLEGDPPFLAGSSDSEGYATFESPSAAGQPFRVFFQDIRSSRGDGFRGRFRGVFADGRAAAVNVLFMSY